jgi:pimeloyl-ACP methyl ester carboxylesterase
VPVFADRYRVVAVDLAGHGESGTGRESWTMPAFGGDVAAVVERLGLDDVVLVGHSMGGDVIVEAARRLGPIVTGLVWVDAYRSLGSPHTPAEVEAFAEPFRHDFVGQARTFVSNMFLPEADPELVDWVVADMSSAPAEVALDAMVHAVGGEEGTVAGLGRLTVPVIAITPDYRPTDAESLRRRGVESVVMPGVGHFLMLEDPETFNALLEAAVQGFA